MNPAAYNASLKPLRFATPGGIVFTRYTGQGDKTEEVVLIPSESGFMAYDANGNLVTLTQAEMRTALGPVIAAGATQAAAREAIKTLSVSNADTVDRPENTARRARTLISCKTAPSGSNWARLPARLTDGVLIAAPAVTMQVRETSGLYFVGDRYIGTWDPNATSTVDALVALGIVWSNNAFPPVAGPYNVGDYFKYVGTVTRDMSAYGLGTVQRRDLIVWNGSAWERKAAPTSVAMAYHYQVSDAGVWDGIELAVGQHLVHFGEFRLDGTRIVDRWVGANIAGKDEYVYMGEIAVADGLPATPYDGEVWQLSDAGSLSPFTVSTGDYIIRADGRWVHQPTSTIYSVTATTGTLRRPVENSNQIEVRQTSKSTTQQTVYARISVASSRAAPSFDLRLRGDSLAGSIAGSPEVIADALPGRTITFSYSPSASPQWIAADFEWECRTTDTYRNATTFICMGQNGTDIGVWSAGLDRIKRVHEGGRLCFISLAGDQTATFAGGRIVVANQENQVAPTISTYIGAQLLALRALEPDTHIDLRAENGADANGEPHLWYPGMTEAEAFAAYGVTPLRHYLNMTLYPWTAADLTFIDYHSTAGLPTGGTDGDYYIRTANGTVGNLLVKWSGTWSEVSWDRVHPHASAGGGYYVYGSAIATFVAGNNW